MKRVFRMREQGKLKEVGRRTLATVPGIESIESKVALIQALIPLGLNARIKGDRFIFRENLSRQTENKSVPF